MSNQYGRSMIEMLGVLAIIGILTTGGFNLIMKTKMHQTINEMVGNMTTLAQKTRHIIRDYQLDLEDGITSDDLALYVYNANIAPDGLDWESNDNKYKWTDRNDITYEIEYVGTTPIFWVKLSGLSEEQCLNMSNGNYGNSSTSGFLGVAYGDDGNTLTASPVSLTTAVSNCAPAQNETTVIMKFGFR